MAATVILAVASLRIPLHRDRYNAHIHVAKPATGERLKSRDGAYLFGRCCRKQRRKKVLGSNHGNAKVTSQLAVDQEEQRTDSEQTVVIVGAGIAGLSAALALHRVGIKTLVLEQSSSIRASGSSLSLWGNAWRALDYLGVAEDLRKKHMLSTRPHEVRGVERRLLVEALAAELPAGTIKVNSEVRAIHRKTQDRLTRIELANGSVVLTRVLVGCDGVNSVVGKWMGLQPARYVGQIGYRGVAEYSNGHDFGSEIIQYLGSGSRVGMFPFSTSKVYWFVVINKQSPGPKVTDATLLKAEILELIKDGWPMKMKELVNKTPLEGLSRATLRDRWNIPGITPPVVKAGVTLGGDALHPMTPNLGQGGGTAIEDSIVLARTLGAVLTKQGGPDDESIQTALEEYAAERLERTFGITLRSFAFGVLLGIGAAPVVFIRDNIAIPKMVSPESFLSHTLYDVGRLPSCEVMPE